MTDQELKDLVASLAVSQGKTNAQMAKTGEMFKELAKNQAETDEVFKELAKSQAKTDVKFKELAEMVGGMGRHDGAINCESQDGGSNSNNNGYFAEATFKNALEKKPRLGKITFNEVSTNWKKRSGKDEAEYDIVLVNGSAVGLVEVKYRLHPNDIKKFAKKQLPLFKKIFPDFTKSKVYGAVAALSYPEGAVEAAQELGLFVLSLDGQKLKIDGKNVKEY